MPGVQDFLAVNELTDVRTAQEVLESAMACDCCGHREVGERHEMEGHSKPHQLPLTFFFCKPCKEATHAAPASH